MRGCGNKREQYRQDPHEVLNSNRRASCQTDNAGKWATEIRKLCHVACTWEQLNFFEN